MSVLCTICHGFTVSLILNPRVRYGEWMLESQLMMSYPTDSMSSTFSSISSRSGYNTVGIQLHWVTHQHRSSRPSAPSAHAQRHSSLLPLPPLLPPTISSSPSPRHSEQPSTSWQPQLRLYSDHLWQTRPQNTASRSRNTPRPRAEL